MKDSSPQMQLIRQTFAILLEKFTEHQQNPLTALPEERIFSSLQFQVDHITWFFVNKDGVVTMEEYSLNTVGDKPLNAACSISTDAATMLKVCRGDMSFPAAYLSGKLKMKGDQKVLKALGVPMKDALDEVRKRQAQFVQAAQRSASKASDSQPSASTENFTLRTKIVEAFAPNFKYNLDEKVTQKPTHAVSKDVAVRYKIEVAIDGTDEVWHVAHRYSHFLNLRSELVEQGYTSIPVITSRSSLFNSLERVVHSRIIHLGFFLNECLAIVGPGNETLNQFLAKPVDIAIPGSGAAAVLKVGSATPQSSRSAGAGASQTPISAASARDRPLDPSSGLPAGPSGLSEYEKVTEEALEHAWGSAITWSNRDLPHSRYLIRELGAQQRSLDALTKASARHTGELVARILRLARTCCLVAVCGVISGYFYEQSFIEDSHTTTHFHAELMLKLTFALLLLFPSTRYWCLFYCLCWLVAINVTVTGVTAVSEIVNKYSEHWTMYRSHIKWLTIKHSVVVVPEEFRTPPSVAFLLRETIPSTLYNMTLGSAHTVLCTTKSAVLSATSVYAAAKTLVSHPSAAFVTSSHAVQEWMLVHVDLPTCAIVSAFGLAAYVLSSPGISRAAWIYALGWFLIVTYATLQISCLVLRLRPSVVETLFDRVDSVMAPFVVMQIGQLRSVFVKFAQYFGGRSDVVSPLWTKLLSELQDACPASSEDYVRRTVEAELGEAMKILQAEDPPVEGSASAKFQLEDVFESFCTTPIASASIGQVHLATLKHDALMRILHLQQRRVVSQAEARRKDARGSERKARSPDEETTDKEDDAAEEADATSSGAPSPAPAPRILSSTSTPVGEPSRVQADAPRSENASREGGSAPDMAWFEASTDPSFTCALPSEASPLVSVVVKVQHEGIGPLMIADMQIVLVLIKWAAMIDSRWETMLQVMRSWDLTMRGELDYREEADNLREMRGIMDRSGLGAATPYPVPGLESPRVLVMTRLFGHKVTDKPALLLHNVDREALLTRIAHCSAYQLLVAGVFNADPHAGNVLFCLSTKSAWKPRSSLSSNREDDFAGGLEGGSVRSDRSFRLSAGRGRTPSESEESSVPDNNASNGSLLDLVPDHSTKDTTYERLIYDATPGKGLQPAAAKPVTAADANTAVNDPKNAPRRIIYDATPAKGVGFALDDSVHSATPYSPASSSLAPTPQSSSTSKVAGSTPFFPPPRRGSLASPAGSVRSAGGRRRDAAIPRTGSFSEPAPASEVPQLVPGLLDFGMTVRLSEERRRAYCRLVIALCDGDLKAASAELRAVGYRSNQSERVPERDAEFFVHMFRDANPRGVSKQERDEFNTMRSQQKADDIAAGTREKGGRSISKVPDDFLFLTRVVGLLRGLTSELDCSCPILYILALNARIGLLEPGDRVK